MVDRRSKLKRDWREQPTDNRESGEDPERNTDALQDELQKRRERAELLRMKNRLKSRKRVS